MCRGQTVCMCVRGGEAARRWTRRCMPDWEVFGGIVLKAYVWTETVRLTACLLAGVSYTVWTVFKLAETNGAYWLAPDAALIKMRSLQTWCQTTEEWRFLIQEWRILCLYFCLPCGAFGGNLLKPCECSSWALTDAEINATFLMSACLWHHLLLKTYCVDSEHQQGCFLILINLARQGLQDSVHPTEKESRPPDPDVASVALFASPCLHACFFFWRIASEKCNGNAKNHPEKPSYLQQGF